MKTYYERRAHEYDDWWLGTGLFADRDRPGWTDFRLRRTQLSRELSRAKPAARLSSRLA